MSGSILEELEERRGRETEQAALEMTVAKLALAGEPVKRISEQVGKTESVVRRILGKAGVRKYMQELKGRMEDKLVELAPGAAALERLNDEALSAVRTLVSIHQDEDVHARDRIAAAKALLAFAPDIRPRVAAGAGEGDKHLHVHLSPTQVDHMRRAMESTGHGNIARLIDAARGGKDAAH